MDAELTKISSAEYDRIVYGKMTPDIAADYLRSGKLNLRTFADSLRAVYPSENILFRLVDFYQSMQPDAPISSISRKLKNWINGSNQPVKREDVFCIAFALGLDEQQLNFLLGVCFGYGVQYRSGRELVYSWFLRNGYGYREAEEFYQTLPAVSRFNQARSLRETHLTHVFQEDFQLITSKEELREAYLSHMDRFGEMHLRAYHYFDLYFSQLIHPTPSWDTSEQEPDYSMERIMETYLSFQMPMGRKRSNYSMIQKLIKHNWPNTTSIKNIRSHREDVPRKLLLLLYVVTENILSDQYSEIDEEYVPLKERIDEHWWTMNAILMDCGMAQLDPRNAIDWIILYAVSATDDETMSGRLEQILHELYQ